MSTPLSAAQAPAEGTGETVTIVGNLSEYRQERVRSATKTDTPLRDTPQSVTVITSDLIKDLAIRSMADEIGRASCRERV
jgi:outer membrane receptor protein involved in Fe transport